MDRSTPVKSRAMKQSDTGHKEDTRGGASIGAPFPALPFWMETRPRGRKKKTAADAKTDNNETNKAEKDCKKAKEPLMTEQEIGAKGTNCGTLRWGETVIKAGLNDPTSYSLGVMTYDTQAKMHPDFIGDAFYYNLTNPAAYDDLEGEYLILYTRPLDRACDQTPLFATFPPNFMGNKITLVTDSPAGNSHLAREVRRLLEVGNVAAGPMTFEGADFMLAIPPLPSGTSSNRHMARVKATLTDVNDNLCSNNPFMGRAVKGTGCCISFGIKVNDQRFNEGTNQMVFWGFHFLKLEVPCCQIKGNISEVRAERQLIVAVKVPHVEGVDICTTFILKQELCTPRDRAILTFDRRAADLADWVDYTHNKEFIQPNPDPKWMAPLSNTVGLHVTTRMRLQGDRRGISEIVGGFQAGVFEIHLLKARDPVQELCDLINWITPHVSNDMYEQGDTLAAAKRYWECRYAAMTNELRLRVKGCQGIPSQAIYEEPAKENEPGIANDEEQIATEREAVSRGGGRDMDSMIGNGNQEDTARIDDRDPTGYDDKTELSHPWTIE